MDQQMAALGKRRSGTSAAMDYVAIRKRRQHTPGWSIRMVALLVLIGNVVVSTHGQGSVHAAPPTNVAPAATSAHSVQAAEPALPTTWTPTDLGTLGGARSYAYDINTAGQVVGVSLLSDQVTGHAFVWTASDGMRDLGTLGGSGSEAFGINDLGQVVGTSQTASGAAHAFVWTASDGMRDLGTLGSAPSIARDINNQGQVVGSSRVTSNGESRAFLWTANDGMRDLGTSGGWTAAFAINDQGTVIGCSGYRCPDAFIWTAADGMRDLCTQVGANCTAEDINNQGQVVGSLYRPDGTRHAYVWSASGGTRDLGPSGALASYAYNINNRGQVLGYSQLTNDRGVAILWTPTAEAQGLPTEWALRELDTVGSHGNSSARSINEAGQIVGYSRAASGDYHATLWTPTYQVYVPITMR